MPLAFLGKCLRPVTCTNIQCVGEDMARPNCIEPGKKTEYCKTLDHPESARGRQGQADSSEPEKFLEEESEEKFEGEPRVDLHTLSKEQLEREVESLIVGSTVDLRANLDKVMELANRYERESQALKAIRLYEKAMEVNATNIPIQMRLAALMAKHSRMEEAITKAQLVEEMAEDEVLQATAQALLISLGRPLAVQKYTPRGDAKNEIILVPLGNVNRQILQSLQQAIESRMGMRVSIQAASKPIGQPERRNSTMLIDNAFQSLQARIGEDKMAALVLKLGLTKDDLRREDHKKKLIHAILQQAGPEGEQAAINFDRYLAEAEKLVQYDVSRLLEELSQANPLQGGTPIRGYLAVTGEDLFKGDFQFLFGSALPGHAVMSVCRFASGFTGEDQNRPRLLKRALKQALSSANLMLGIARCTNPNCARAYPNSLEELDQKPDTLCPLCQGRLETFLRSKH